MKELFKSEERLRKDQVASKVYKNIAKKQFIINFFKNLPIEYLEKLINFKENQDEYAENLIKFNCELYLDNGIDSLIIGEYNTNQ